MHFLTKENKLSNFDLSTSNLWKSVKTLGGHIGVYYTFHLVSLLLPPRVLHNVSNKRNYKTEGA